MRIIIALALAVLPMATAADVITEMTPERIREAIAAAGEPEPDYTLCEGICGDGVTVMLATPFTMVKFAAQQAQRKYLPYTENDVDSSLLKPVVRVYVPGFNSVSIEHMVVVSDEGVVTQPLSTKVEKGLRNSGLGATFPVAALAPGNELRVVLSSGREAVFTFSPTLLAKIR